MGLLLAPVLWGTLASIIDSGSSAPQQQALFDTIYRNQSSTTLQSFQLSEVRSSAAQDPEPNLFAEVVSGPAFVWPAYGNITSYMDHSHPMGIDIGLDYDEDSPIVAAARGIVSYTGGSDLDGYGYYVKVDHGNGLVTLYAHLSEILVSTGQEVAQGDLLGLGGSTGKSSGKHLHFEVRLGDYLTDPLALLPPMGEGPVAQSLDCQTSYLTLERGSVTHLEFGGSLPEGTRLVGASVNGIETGRPWPFVELVSNTAARIEAHPGLDLGGEPVPDIYSLSLIVEGVRRHEKTCEVHVIAKSGSFTPYSEASHVASSNGSPFEDPELHQEHSEYVEPTIEPEPTVEPTTEAEPPADVPTEEPTPTDAVVVPTDIPMLGEASTPTPEPTETATPTETSTATETPEATETPVPDTATPEPTVADESPTQATE